MRAGSGGFTLVEFLIALVLISLISSLLFAGVRLGGRSWDAVQVNADALDGMRFSRDFIRRGISQARAVKSGDKGSGKLLFWGNREMLEWVAPLPERSGLGGLAIFRLSRQSAESESPLVLDRWIYHPDILSGQGSAEVPSWEPLARVDMPLPQGLAASLLYGRHLLLERVEQFSVEYFGQRDGENEPSWNDRWLGQERFPDLLRISIAVTGDEWPDMIIALDQPDEASAVADGFVAGPRE